MFFTRQEAYADSLPFGLDELRKRFAPIAAEFEMQWRISSNSEPKRVVVLASALTHCLSDVFHRVGLGELNIEIAGVISNHTTTEKMCEVQEVPFHHVPMDVDKAAGLARIERLIDEMGADVIVLARFMQILPPALCTKYARTDNQHSSQLSAFIQRCQTLSPRLRTGSEADWRHLPLCHRSTGRGSDHRAGRGSRAPRRFCRHHGEAGQGRGAHGGCVAGLGITSKTESSYTATKP